MSRKKSTYSVERESTSKRNSVLNPILSNKSEMDQGESIKKNSEQKMRNQALIKEVSELNVELENQQKKQSVYKREIERVSSEFKLSQAQINQLNYENVQLAKEVNRLKELKNEKNKTTANINKDAAVIEKVFSFVQILNEYKIPQTIKPIIEAIKVELDKGSKKNIKDAIYKELLQALGKHGSSKMEEHRILENKLKESNELLDSKTAIEKDLQEKIIKLKDKIKSLKNEREQYKQECSEKKSKDHYNDNSIKLAYNEKVQELQLSLCDSQKTIEYQESQIKNLQQTISEQNSFIIRLQDLLESKSNTLRDPIDKYLSGDSPHISEQQNVAV